MNGLPYLNWYFDTGVQNKKAAGPTRAPDLPLFINISDQDQILNACIYQAAMGLFRS